MTDVLDLSDDPDAASSVQECHAERLPDGRWIARCPALDLWATGHDSLGASFRLALLLARAMRN